MSDIELLKNQINTAMATYHQAAQFLAMLSHSFLPHADDDSHNNLLWVEGGLRTRLISNVTSFYGHLDYTSFSFFFIDKKGKTPIKNGIPNQGIGNIATIPLSDKSWNTVYEEICAALQLYNFATLSYQPITHFEIPDHPVKRGGTFLRPSPEMASKIMELRTEADKALAFFAPRIQEGLDIRIWPHHFDSGTYGTLANGKDGIGMGWAIADTVHDVPYFYLSPYTPGRTISYENELKWQGPGRFNQDSFTGATLPLDNYLFLSPDEREQLIFSFFDYGFRYLKQSMES